VINRISARHDLARTGAQAVTVVVVVVVTVLLARQLAMDWSRLGERALRESLHLDPRPLVATWFVQTLGWVLMVATWRAMLGPEGRPVTFARHLRAYAYSGLTQVLPGSVWAPISRVALYRQEGVGALAVGAALVVEWLLVGLAGLLLYGLAAPWSLASPPLPVAWLVAAGLVALAILYPPNFARAVRWAARRTGTSVDPVTPGPRRLAACLGAEVVVLTLGGLSLAGVMMAISPRASVVDAIAAFGLTTAIANLLAWLPATGVLRAAAFVLLLTPVYQSSVVALAVIIGWHLWVMVVQLSWATLAAVLAARRSGVPAEPDGADRR
jgi:hypothetical protein